MIQPGPCQVASKLHAMAMGAEELLEGLDQVVVLLHSRPGIPVAEGFVAKVFDFLWKVNLKRYLTFSGFVWF